MSPASVTVISKYLIVIAEKQAAIHLVLTCRWKCQSVLCSEDVSLCISIDG